MVENAATAQGNEVDDWAACMGLDDEEVEVTNPNILETELQNYMSEPNIPRNNSPFVWWSANEHRFPNLGQLARRYLSAPMGSVASEREFKGAKRVVTGRWSLKAQNVEKLLFLKYNLRMLGYTF